MDWAPGKLTACEDNDFSWLVKWKVVPKRSSVLIHVVFVKI